MVTLPPVPGAPERFVGEIVPEDRLLRHQTAQQLTAAEVRRFPRGLLLLGQRFILQAEMTIAFRRLVAFDALVVVLGVRGGSVYALRRSVHLVGGPVAVVQARI